MSAAINFSIYQSREFAAQAGTVMAGMLIFVASHTLVIHQEEPPKEEPISLTIIAPPVTPEKIIEQPVQAIQPPQPEKVVTPVKEILPVTEAPVQEQAVLPTSPIQPVTPKEVVAPTPQVQKSNGAAEGQFAQDVRSRIERKKIYPDAARDLGMSGEVEVQYELDRGGNLIHAEIVSSSGFKLLDQAALRAVKSASYQRFPEDAWLGVSSKVFRTKLVFSINQ